MLTRYLIIGLGIALPRLGLAQDQTLTIERIFASPDLSGPNVRGLEISPDGERVTFLQGKQDDREQLDLWEYHVRDGERRMLVDSKLLAPEENLSDEEKARRERRRLGGLRGIVEYSWAENGKALLIPLGGDLYYYDLTKPAAQATKRLTATEAFETDPQLSPQGRYASFIRDQNLFVLEIATGQETQLTRDGGGAVKNGMAEFIAQEEMGRDTGYWWSDDDARIAFIRVDETPVAITRRSEIYADRIETVEQRYPHAGEANVLVGLGVVAPATGKVTWIDLGRDTDFYLPRVEWLPDSRTLSYQWQSRDQKTLELRFVDVETGRARTVITERADTWINLHDDLHFLETDDGFIWASERSGFKHLYWYGSNGDLRAQLTSGDWAVDELQGVDEKGGRAFFTAALDSPRTQHLYSVSLSADSPASIRRITRDDGWHAVTMNEAATVYLDRYSNAERPHRITLHRSDGRRLTGILENAVDPAHPYWPYHRRHRPTAFGTLHTDDGGLLHYRMTKPETMQDGATHPALVYVYGGPRAQVVRNQWLPLFEQYMAQQGFVVFALDNRGSARRGTRFEATIHLQMGEAEVEDQLRGIRYLKSLPYIDPDRIGIFGWSYGGYMTLMSLLKAPQEFAAGVAVAPVTDWRLYDTHYTERYLGHPAQNARGYEMSSVFPWIESLMAPLPPLLIMHGMADDNVLFTNSTKAFKALQDKGILFDSMTYPGAKHGLSGAQTQTHAYRTIAAFFERHLGSSQ
jgi:dipeptidyl-peptidase-4